MQKRRRSFIAVVATGVALSLAPLSMPVVHAERAVTAVTGLARGARGDAVRSVQQALVDQGVQVAGGVDGIFGAGTEAAVRDFQAEHGLSASGQIDEATALALGLTSSPVMGLEQGARGAEVEQLQQRLVDAGVPLIGGVDGIFGPGTKAAVQEFQAAKGLSATGRVDAATAAALATGSAPVADDTDDDAGADAGDDTADAPGFAGLRIGSRGPAVTRLQSTLIAAGFTVVGGADGIFGALTANAVKSFQNANGLVADGIVGERTAAVLDQVTGATGGSDDDDAETHDPAPTNPFVGLQYGSLGSDVKALQQALIDAGIRVRGGADGVFGTATRDAVKEFQSRHGVDTSGKVDADTANLLSSDAGTPGGSPLIGLKAGALGNTVKALQQALIDAGVKVRGGADGIFGPATANAVREFQTSQGLEATGVIDDATAAALDDPAVPTGDAGGADDAELGYAAYGERGQRVIALQAALVEAGITVRGGVDGDFGSNTSAAVMEFQRREGLSVTGTVSRPTAEALDLEAMPEPQAPDPTSVTLDVFPVQGRCSYGDSYGYPRGGGRVHLGVDIIAAEGKLLYAVADGTITKVYADYPGSLAGNGIRLTTADGTYFFYAHMVGVADGIEVGAKVKAGQIVGAVGSTGSSGTNHLHLEVHPQGGAAVNPYPLVKAIDACDVEEPLPQP